MKNLLIIFLLLLHNQTLLSQNKDGILIDKSFVEIVKNSSVANVHNVFLYIKSNDKRFNLDLYNFQVINSISFDILNFEELKVEYNDEILTNSINLDDLKKMSACEVHECLSLSNNILLISKINDKYYYWRMNYVGTLKNTVMTKL